MSLFLALVVSGIVSGSMIGLIALGVVLVYRTARVVNFAHGAVAMAATYAYFLAHLRLGLPGLVAFVFALVAACLIGLLIHATISRLPGDQALTRVMMTVAWLTGLQSAAVIFIQAPQRVPGLLPAHSFKVGVLNVTLDQVAIVAVAAVLAGALAWMLRATRLGLEMRAVSQNVETAQLAGIRVDRILKAAWVIGALLAAVAGILISPLLVLEPTILPVMILAQALAAAVAARLYSLPIALAAGIGLGVVTSVLAGFVTPGNAELLSSARSLVPLAVVLTGLGVHVSRGRLADA